MRRRRSATERRPAHCALKAPARPVTAKTVAAIPANTAGTNHQGGLVNLRLIACPSSFDRTLRLTRHVLHASRSGRRVARGAHWPSVKATTAQMTGRKSSATQSAGQKHLAAPEVKRPGEQAVIRLQRAVADRACPARLALLDRQASAPVRVAQPRSLMDRMRNR